MHKILLFTMLALALIACDRQDEPRTTSSVVEQANDYNGKNIRDRDLKMITPVDQSESEADRTITQKIREAIVSDATLSINAKNIKIITIDGVVTLRGPVANSHEKEIISRKVHDIQGVVKLDNQIEVTNSN